LVRFLAISTLLTLSACAAGHSLTGTPVEVTPNLPAAPVTFQAKTVAQAPLLSNWLDQFDDPRLIEIVSEALIANPNILANEATARAAKQNARAIFGRSLPSLSYGLNNGFGTSVNPRDIGGAIFGARATQPSFDQRLNYNWELDLWGRVRAGNEAAKADYVASQADLNASQLSIGGQAAISWINLNAALEQERIARDTVASRQSILDLTERRFGRGLSTALDVRTARTQLHTAEAQVAARTQTSHEAARALEVLLGRYPANEIEAPSALPVLGPLQNPGSPVELLSRRPDMAAIEARLEAAGLRAEAARLAIFPAFTVSGSVSNSSGVEFADIFDPQQLSANIMQSFTQPLWNGGAIKADRKAALANAEATASNYVNTALTAWREVEDALDADQLLAEQEEAQRLALEEAILAEDLATRQYQNGLVTIFNLLNSQTTRLTSESSLVQASTARAINRVNYHMALGGGAGPQDNTPATPATTPTTITSLLPADLHTADPSQASSTSESVSP